jgi:hypothetical protein
LVFAVIWGLLEADDVSHANWRTRKTSSNQ